MGIVGGYTLHLYCDCDGDGVAWGTQGHSGNPGEYYGPTRTEAIQRAKRAGWTFKAGGRCLSPQCREAGRKL